MVIVTTLLLGLVGLKLVAIGNAIAWLYRQGTRYRPRLVTAPPDTTAAQYRLYDELDGGFFPFGVKDYRLRRMRDTATGRGGWLRRASLRLFQTVLFQFGWLTAICMAYLVAAPHLAGMPALAPRSVDDLGRLVLAVVLLLGTILVAAEAVVGYSMLGSYGTAFHIVPPARRNWERGLLKEFEVFAGAVLTAHLAGVGALYSVSTRSGGFDKLAGLPADLPAALLRVADCSYATLMVFLGASDPSPRSFEAKLVTGLVGAQGLSYLILVFASMLSIATKPAPTTAATPAEPRQAPQDPPAVPVDPATPAPGRAMTGRRYLPVAVGFALGVLTVVALRARRRARSRRAHHVDE